MWPSLWFWQLFLQLSLPLVLEPSSADKEGSFESLMNTHGHLFLSARSFLYLLLQLSFESLYDHVFLLNLTVQLLITPVQRVFRFTGLHVCRLQFLLHNVDLQWQSWLNSQDKCVFYDYNCQERVAICAPMAYYFIIYKMHFTIWDKNTKILTLNKVVWCDNIC